MNLRAPFVLLQESIAPMRARGGGSIVNIGSILAHAAAYFASDESECVTGSVLDLEQYPLGAMPNS